MKQNNLRDLYKYAQQNQTKVKRGILYSILNKLFDLAPPVLIGVAIDIVVEVVCIVVDDDVVDSITIVFSSSSEVLDVQEEIKHVTIK